MTTRDTRTSVLVAMLCITSVMAGCSAAPRDEMPFGGTEGGAAVGDSSSSAASGANATTTDARPVDPGADSSSSGGSDGPSDVLLDVGAPGDTGSQDCIGDDCGCTAVDVLFVIDNSGSMCSYQDGLRQAFPSFVDAMYEALPSGTDLHVGITTSGFSLGGSHSETNCEAGEDQSTLEQHYVRPTDGVVEGNGLQGRLLEHAGSRYFAVDTANDASKADLSEWFSGAAGAVGCQTSSFEFPAAGASWALHPANDDTNAGFLRDEGAVLVLFALTDEADQSLDVESLETLRQNVLDAKAGCGGQDCVVTGGLLSTWCAPDQSATHTFLSSFGSDPVWGDIAGGDFLNPNIDGYMDVVGDAFAEVVAQTCEEITPEG